MGTIFTTATGAVHEIGRLGKDALNRLRTQEVNILIHQTVTRSGQLSPYAKPKDLARLGHLLTKIAENSGNGRKAVIEKAQAVTLKSLEEKPNMQHHEVTYLGYGQGLFYWLIHCSKQSLYEHGRIDGGWSIVSCHRDRLDSVHTMSPRHIMFQTKEQAMQHWEQQKSPECGMNIVEKPINKLTDSDLWGDDDLGSAA